MEDKNKTETEMETLQKKLIEKSNFCLEVVERVISKSNVVEELENSKLTIIEFNSGVSSFTTGTLLNVLIEKNEIDEVTMNDSKRNIVNGFHSLLDSLRDSGLDPTVTALILNQCSSDFLLQLQEIESVVSNEVQEDA